MKRVAVIFGILVFLLDLGYDGCPGKIRFAFQVCAYEMGVSDDAGHEDVTRGGNEIDLHHCSKSSFNIDLQTLTFLETPNISESMPNPSAFLDTLPANALRIIDLCYIGGSGGMPLLL